MTIIPIYNRIIVPHANIFLPVDAFKKLSGKDPVENEKLIFLIAT